MDVCESSQALVTPKPKKSNGTIGRPRPREVDSRYKSPTPRRRPSPNTTRTVTTSVPMTKRAVSTERRPPSPPRPSTPVQDTSVDTELAARKMIGGKLPESLWPSRMRSLSVSFQSNTFSLPISKREKPPPQALPDRTLKPSSNGSQPAYRKATPERKRSSTPERKRSPLRGKNAIDQSENSKPVDGLHARLIDQHRWPSRTDPNAPDKAIRTFITPNPGANSTTKPLQKSTSDAARPLSSLSDNARLEFDNPQRTSSLVTSSSLETNALVAPAVRSLLSLPNTGSLPSSPNRPSGVISRGFSSPSRTRALTSVPSRGVSPAHIRPSSPLRQSSNSNTVSVLTFVADLKRGKKVTNHIEEAHHLRLMYNRQVQWRFVNAGAEAVLNSQKSTAERSLFNARETTSQLQDSVAARRINLYRLRLQLKLYMVLNKQMVYVNEWSLIERDHKYAVYGAIEDLQASTLRLPVTGGATADIETVKSTIFSAIQVMQSMGSSIHSTLSRLEGTDSLISELATIAARERALLDECESLLASAASLQEEEYSLTTHLVQLKQAWDGV